MLNMKSDQSIYDVLSFGDLYYNNCLNFNDNIRSVVIKFLPTDSFIIGDIISRNNSNRFSK